MDALVNGHSISAKEELQSLYCMMGKPMSLDVIFSLLMVDDWQASFGAGIFCSIFGASPILQRHYLFDT